MSEVQVEAAEIDNTPAEDAKQKVDDSVQEHTEKQQDNQQPVLSPKSSDHDILSDVVEEVKQDDVKDDHQPHPHLNLKTDVQHNEPQIEENKNDEVEHPIAIEEKDEHIDQHEKSADPILAISEEDYKDDADFREDEQISDNVSNKEPEPVIETKVTEEPTQPHHDIQSGTPKVSFIKAANEHVEDNSPNTIQNPIYDESPQHDSQSQAFVKNSSTLERVKLSKGFKNTQKGKKRIFSESKK